MLRAWSFPKAGSSRRTPVTNEEKELYNQRLEVELEAIDAQHLTVAFSNLARSKHTCANAGFIRLSLVVLAGSLVTFSLWLTPVCPIRCGLRFDDPMCLERIDEVAFMSKQLQLAYRPFAALQTTGNFADLSSRQHHDEPIRRTFQR